MDILDYRTISVEDVVFESPIKTKTNAYVSKAFLKTDSGEKKELFIQTPRLQLLSGIHKTGNRAFYELEIDANHNKFYNFLKSMDEQNIMVIQENSKQWFQQEIPLDVVEQFYRGVVKLGRDQTAPQMKLNLLVEDEEIKTDIFDSMGNRIFYKDVPDQCKVISVLKFVGLRFLQQNVVCLWVPSQLMVDKTVEKNTSGLTINKELLSDREEEEAVEAEQVSEEAPEETEQVSEETEKIVELLENPEESEKYVQEQEIEEVVLEEEDTPKKTIEQEEMDFLDNIELDLEEEMSEEEQEEQEEEMSEEELDAANELELNEEDVSEVAETSSMKTEKQIQTEDSDEVVILKNTIQTQENMIKLLRDKLSQMVDMIRGTMN